MSFQLKPVMLGGGYTYITLTAPQTTAQIQAVLDAVNPTADADDPPKSTVIKFKGNFTGLGNMTVKPYTIIDCYEAKLKLADSTDDSMFEQSGTPSDGHIMFRGGTFHGNRTGQGVEAPLFNFSMNNKRYLSFQDISIMHANGYGISLTSAMMVQMHNIWIVDATPLGNQTLGGLELTTVYDSEFSNLTLAVVGAGTYRALYMNGGAVGSGCTSNVFKNVYIGGGLIGLELYGTYRCGFQNLIVNDCSQHGILLHGAGAANTDARYNVFHGYRVSANGSQTDNTYDNIQLDDYANHNIFLGIESDTSAHANVPRYDINEDDANCDYNMIANCILKGASTAALRLQGAHTEASHNITS